MKTGERPSNDWLEKEVNQWCFEGIISQRQGKKILTSYGIEKPLEPLRNPLYARDWLIWIGLILIGLGLVLGGGGSQLFSNVTLFGLTIAGLIVAYGLGYYFTYVKTNYPLLGQIIILAGVFLFGYGLWRLNQSYNIYVHTPTLLLLWAVGIVPLAYLLRSKLLLLLSLLLFIGWTGWYSVQFRSPNFAFLPLALIILFPLIYRERSKLALVIGLLGLSLWIGMAVNAYSTSAQIFIPILFVLWSLLMYGLSYLHTLFPKYQLFQRTYSIFGVILLFVSLSFLAFRTFGLTLARFWLSNPRWLTQAGLASLSFGIVFTLAIVIVLWLTVRKEPSRSLIFKSEIISILILGLSIWIYLLLPERIPRELSGSLLPDYFLFYPLLFNILLIALMIGLIGLGIKKKDALLLNLGMSFAVLTVIARYFDMFWTKLPKTTYFFVGGILLLLGGVWIGKKEKTETSIAGGR